MRAEKGVQRHHTQERLLELRRERDISIHRRCSMSDVTASTLNNIISGRTRSATVSTVKKPCDGLGITMADFFHSTLFRDLEQEMQLRQPFRIHTQQIGVQMGFFFIPMQLLFYKLVV